MGMEHCRWCSEHGSWSAFRSAFPRACSQTYTPGICNLTQIHFLNPETRFTQVVAAVEALHVGSSEFLEKRTKWRRGQALTILELQAWRLKEPLVVTPKPEHFGCFSWGEAWGRGEVGAGQGGGRKRVKCCWCWRPSRSTLDASPGVKPRARVRWGRGKVGAGQGLNARQGCKCERQGGVVRPVRQGTQLLVVLR